MAAAAVGGLTLVSMLVGFGWEAKDRYDAKADQSDLETLTDKVDDLADGQELIIDHLGIERGGG